MITGTRWAAVALLVVVPCAAQGAHELRIIAGRSTVIDYAADIARISTSNPDVADAVAVSTREVLVHGKAQGSATVIVWPKTGPRTVFDIEVMSNLEPLRQLLRETFPGLNIQVQASRDALSLTGTVPSKELGERAAGLAVPFAKAVVNNLLVVSPGPDKQILLRVRFAELNRTASDAFGVNLVSTGAANTPGSMTTGQFQVPRPTELAGVIPGRNEGTTSKFTVTDALNVFAFRPDLNLAAFIKALQTQGLLQILAEPNLVTTNGKEASFLVGGEFPVPIVQGGVNAGAITIVFKEFGIRLSFLPLLTEHRTIRMQVRPEVSTVDMANAIQFSGFTIPALATRRAETFIELGEGQSFVIAGLIDDRVTENLSRIPGLSHIPILGALFKSRQQNKSKTELIVMVTPEITSAVAAKALPAMPRTFLEPHLFAEPAKVQPAPEQPRGRK